MLVGEEKKNLSCRCWKTVKGQTWKEKKEQLSKITMLKEKKEKNSLIHSVNMLDTILFGLKKKSYFESYVLFFFSFVWFDKV